MFTKLRPRLTYANVIATLALFLALSTGGAYATHLVVDSSDVDEASLGAVPSALLGGFGRWRGGGYCDPNSTTYVTCGVVTLNLPSQSRVLVNAVLMAEPDAIAYSDVLGSGVCRVATSLGSLPNSSVAVIVEQGRLINEREAVAVTAITDPLGGGTVDFGVECNESSWTDPRYGIQFQSVNVSAVALSPN